MEPIYQVVVDKYIPDVWRVEGFDDDGTAYSAVFYGPDSKRRAIEYAHYKNPF
jgi:hypothetical protein